jgi:hypothetical protein
MAKIVLRKLDRLIDILSLLLITGGGMIIHILTCLTIRSYYGDLWGYVSFLLPGIAESFLIFVQLGDSMYNYLQIVTLFTGTSLTLALALLFKNLIRSKFAALLDNNSANNSVNSSRS